MDFIFPVSKYLTITQGYHANHLGNDYGWNGSIPGANGQAIIASEAGTVTTAVDGYGNTWPNSRKYGNYVIISHGDGWYTLYGHLAKGLSVSTGQKVAKGQPLGFMGDTGYSRGQHLHFELRKGGNSKDYAVDPLDYVMLEDRGIVVSVTTLYPDRIKYRQTSVGMPVGKNPYVDQVEVLIDALNGRSAASINADRLGYITPGFYNVRAEQKGGDYTWYELEPGLWCAAGEGWTRFYSTSAAPAGSVFLRIGPMSGGDFNTIQKQAQALSVGAKDNGDGTLTVGPVSGGDQKTIENLAASLLLPVEVIVTPGPEPVAPPENDPKKVIDLSEFNTVTDWGKVKADGVEAVILRAGFRGYGSAGNMKPDALFESHYKGAQSVGLPVGVYFFSQAKNASEGVEEAEFLLNLVKGKTITYPVYFDSELGNNGSGRADGISRADRTEAAKAFCDRLLAAGYRAGVYASISWFNNQLDMEQLRGYELWVAHYATAEHPEYQEQFGMWQYTSSGSVDGITGNVDLNRCYKDYTGTVPVQPEPQDDAKDKQIAELTAKVAELEAENKALKEQIAELAAENARLAAREAEQSQDIVDLNAEISRLLKIIQDAISVLTGV